MKRDHRVGLAARHRQNGRATQSLQCLEINNFLPGSSKSLSVELTITCQLHGTEPFLKGI
jgi:hypothetical protein